MDHFLDMAWICLLLWCNSNLWRSLKFRRLNLQSLVLSNYEFFNDYSCYCFKAFPWNLLLALDLNIFGCFISIFILLNDLNWINWGNGPSFLSRAKWDRTLNVRKFKVLPPSFYNSCNIITSRCYLFDVSENFLPYTYWLDHARIEEEPQISILTRRCTVILRQKLDKRVSASRPQHKPIATIERRTCE